MTGKRMIGNLVGISGAVLVVLSGARLLQAWIDYYPIDAAGGPQINLHEGGGFVAGCIICALAVRMLPRKD